VEKHQVRHFLGVTAGVSLCLRDRDITAALQLLLVECGKHVGARLIRPILPGLYGAASCEHAYGNRRLHDDNAVLTGRRSKLRIGNLLCHRAA
jgi:hypothetical protein